LSVWSDITAFMFISSLLTEVIFLMKIKCYTILILSYLNFCFNILSYSSNIYSETNMIICFFIAI
jgi:hypothetical protein